MRLPAIADEAHAPRFEIGKPADVVVHHAVGADRQRIHGEVAPLGVRPPVAAEAHLGVAAEGLDVLAQRRHLERPAVDHHGDGAVLDAGRHRLEARRGGAAHHLFGHGRGGDVEFADRLAEQRVAHRAADHARLLAVAVEHREQPRQRALAQPRGILQRAAAARSPHLSRNEIAALVDMGRHVGRARRRAGEMREHDEAADHQHQRARWPARRAPSAATTRASSTAALVATQIDARRRRTAPGTAQAR